MTPEGVATPIVDALFQVIDLGLEQSDVVEHSGLQAGRAQ